MTTSSSREDDYTAADYVNGREPDDAEEDGNGLDDEAKTLI